MAAVRYYFSDDRWISTVHSKGWNKGMRNRQSKKEKAHLKAKFIDALIE